jgi:chemotaxis protein CheD
MTALIELPRTGIATVARRPVYLQAGQLIAVAEPAVISTILGSCVAICLWDERRSIGGMNHYMLPFLSARQAASPRFGVVAFEMLLDQLSGLGAELRDLRAGVFGGACVMDAFRSDPGHIGNRNIELAEQQLQAAAIPIVHRDVGGRRGRKLIFETDTGHVTVKEL